MLCKRPVNFIFLFIFFFIGVLSCSTPRSLLLKSLPNDGSWFTAAKKVALTHGEINDVLGYFWTSRTIYINAEKLYYTISYFPKESMSIPMPKTVALSKHHGSLNRLLVYDEDKNEYTLMDSDFLKRNTPEKVTKERAEELAYAFFKELNRYGLY